MVVLLLDEEEDEVAATEVVERRISPHTGALEYRTRHTSGSCSPWAMRSCLLAPVEEEENESRAGRVNEADVRELQAIDGLLDRWVAWKHRANQSSSLSPTTLPSEPSTLEQLKAIAYTHRPDPFACPDGANLNSLILLGDVMLEDDAAAVLNEGRRVKRRRTPTLASFSGVDSHEMTVEELCSSAQSIEGEWHRKYAESYRQSCAVSSSVCPSSEVSCALLGECTEERSRKSMLSRSLIKIISIVPVSVEERQECSAWPPITSEEQEEEEASRRRRYTPISNQIEECSLAQSPCPQRDEPFVVRCWVPRQAGSDWTGIGTDDDEEEDDEERSPTSMCVVSIPLCVFRHTWPQLLLQYLLQHTLVLE